MMKEITGPTGAQIASTSQSKLPLDQQQQQEVNITVASLAIRSRKPELSIHDPTRRDDREDYHILSKPLYDASIRCDWKAAKDILDKNPESVTYSINKIENRALHVAVAVKRSKQQEKFVENLVNRMKKEDLELRSEYGNTALYIAAGGGNIKIVRIMVEKNRNLTTIPGCWGKRLPLYVAALYGHYEVVKYLYEKSNNLCKKDGWNNKNRGDLLVTCVKGDMFDIALKIVKKHSTLFAKEVLGILARKPDAFSETTVFSFKKESTALRLLRFILEDISKRPKEEIDSIFGVTPDSTKQHDKRVSRKPIQARGKSYPSWVHFVAAEMGNTSFLVELIREYHDLIWAKSDDNPSIFHIAVKHRRESVYNLLYEIGTMKDLITIRKDASDNNMLHLAAKMASEERLANVSGAALQMQRELLWFKEVHNTFPLYKREEKNKDGLTPRELFTQEHKGLIKEGEKWMKETASQCMVVATLIATIVFAAAFTVPGGYNQNDGIPIFYRKPIFVVFVVADAMSLFLSSSSILTFLSLLTSRYAEHDFEGSLPKKLMLGLVTLFLSIATMVITFSISFFILYNKEMKWIPILISIVALIPVLLYVWLQYHVLADVARAAYGSRHLFKPEKQVLYNLNNKPNPVFPSLYEERKERKGKTFFSFSFFPFSFPPHPFLFFPSNLEG